MPVHQYYLTEVDKEKDSIYCMHDLMGEKDIPFHQHRKAQFLYTEGGIVYVSTEAKTYFLPARHYMWIPSGVRHSIHPSSPDVMMRNLYFPVEAWESTFFQRTAIYPINDLLLQMILFCNNNNGDIQPEDLSAYRFSLALKAILPSFSHHDLPLALPYPKDGRLSSLITYMQENLAEVLAFPELAKRCSLSERSLSRLFQSDVGMSFVQYLTLQRMICAVQYLLEDKLPIKQVAMLVGYNSVPTFSNTFYKILGVRPSDYVRIEGVLGRG